MIGRAVMDLGLRDTVALIVGGASGIGWASAQAFAAEGAKVVIADLNGETAADRAASLPQAWSRRVDVTSEDDIQALFAAVIEREGRLDSVVSCAGIGHLGAIRDIELADWQNVIDICLTGSFLVMKHAARVMTGGGSIVNIASLNARQTAAGYGVYSAAKRGLTALAEVAALELAADGVRVNTISPGLIDTPLTNTLRAIPGVQEEFTDNTPLRRNGRPEDIAATALFLCSSMADWTTGDTLDVNGGGHLQRYPNVMAAAAALTPEEFEKLQSL
ncbi:SDR family NAD(P)-dependent oxidoreductase [Cumulibacter soli]|uniref:SDR family NAD(P)-dependent oxidoreductase n=1 Tax=Cumulibacter soli TaxID=2546344 RepID=UPI001FB99BAF|nr:SDR family oxidoreductase [Cumulibacter soli]